jgi:hypothetical protein
VRKKEKDGFTHSFLNKYYEVTQSQGISKEVSTLSNSLENKLKRVSRSVQNIFALDKLAVAMSGYANVIGYAEHTKLNNLYSLLCNPCFLLIVYNDLKKYAPVGLDNVGRSSVILSGLCSLSKKLFSERYKPMLVRRLYLDKLQSGERPLSVQSTCDKVIQKAVQILIQPKFDIEFSDYSHGFRPLKSCHTALNDIC